MNPKTEPVAAAGSVIVGLQAIYVLCAAFGHSLTTDQAAAITSVVVLVVIPIARQFVYASHGMSAVTVASIQTDRAVAAAQSAGSAPPTSPV